MSKTSGKNKATIHGVQLAITRAKRNKGSGDLYLLFEDALHAMGYDSDDHALDLAQKLEPAFLIYSVKKFGA